MNLTRSSTRVHAPPGGGSAGSSFIFGGGEVTATAAAPPAAPAAAPAAATRAPAPVAVAPAAPATPAGPSAMDLLAGLATHLAATNPAQPLESMIFYLQSQQAVAAPAPAPAPVAFSTPAKARPAGGGMSSSPIFGNRAAAAAAPAAAAGLADGSLAAVSDVAANNEIQALLDALRASLKTHGASGIAGLARKFRIMDDDNSRHLDMSEFSKAMVELKQTWSKDQIQAVYTWFDKDGCGVSFDEFLAGVRGKLNARREQLVLQAFAVVDADGNGVLELSDIVSKYNADKHPDVIAGKRTKSEIFAEFLDVFDVGGSKDGMVHPYEFVNYYANVSASIDDDDYFELMIRNAWHMSGGEGWCANTSCRRVLVTHADGSQTVQEVRVFFTLLV
jgi:Ca2+-binding EF-hand superfamily protein